nr:shikimate kinase [uncultured Desulfobulbus sp.]
MENILLVGFMGVGKGRTARALAAETGMFAVDTDDLIESFVKQKIRTLFAQQGESTFREFEKKTGRWLENQVQGTIISTGGGFFMVENLNRIGKVVYLHSSLEGIIATIMRSPHAAKKIKKRPLLQDMDKAESLYRTRLPLYRSKADFEVNVEARKTSDVVADIVSLLRKDGVL